MYKSESNGDIKFTKLVHRTLYPNNFEKQKVHLVCNFFNEKTCIVLAQNNMKGTYVREKCNPNVEHFKYKVFHCWNKTK